MVGARVSAPSLPLPHKGEENSVSHSPPPCGEGIGEGHLHCGGGIP